MMSACFKIITSVFLHCWLGPWSHINFSLYTHLAFTDCSFQLVQVDRVNFGKLSSAPHKYRVNTVNIGNTDTYLLNLHTMLMKLQYISQYSFNGFIYLIYHRALRFRNIKKQIKLGFMMHQIKNLQIH